MSTASIKETVVRVGAKFDSQVDIVIPYHSAEVYLLRLLKSLFRLTSRVSYRVFLIDDCSPNQTFGPDLISEEKLDNLFYFRTPDRLGFAGSCEYGLKKTTNSYVCFLNSDCLVTDPAWLVRLGEALIDYRKQNVRVVSPVTDNPVGGHELQRGEQGLEDNVCILDNDSSLSLYCFMVHRDLFSHSGGFLKSYGLGMYEDVEWAHRLNKFGFRQAIVRHSFIQHVGEVTFKRAFSRNPENITKLLEENRLSCIRDIKSLLR